MKIQDENMFQLNPELINENNVPDIWSIFNNAFFEIEHIIIDDATDKLKLQSIQSCLHRTSMSLGRQAAFKGKFPSY
jgi:hypothetical protein